MSTQYHKAFKKFESLTSRAINTRLAELDEALVNTKFSGFNLDDGGTLTIASDSITPTDIIHQVDTQGMASSDNLSTITHTSGLDFLIFRVVSESRSITISTVGNIVIPSGFNITLSKFYHTAFLIWDETNSKWVLLSPRTGSVDYSYLASVSGDWSSWTVGSIVPAKISKALDEVANHLSEGNLLYTPADSTDWLNTTPTLQDDALDRLASRLTDIENTPIVFNNADLFVSNNSWTTLTFNSERTDLGSWHSTSTNTSRITVPSEGLYFIWFSAQWENATTGDRALRIIKNGFEIVAKNDLTDLTPADSVFGHSISSTFWLEANDYVEIQAFQDSGSALNINVSGDYSPFFGITKVALPSDTNLTFDVNENFKTDEGVLTLSDASSRVTIANGTFSVASAGASNVVLSYTTGAHTPGSAFYSRIKMISGSGIRVGSDDGSTGFGAFPESGSNISFRSDIASISNLLTDSLEFNDYVAINLDNSYQLYLVNDKVLWFRTDTIGASGNESHVNFLTTTEAELTDFRIADLSDFSSSSHTWSDIYEASPVSTGANYEHSSSNFFLNIDFNPDSTDTLLIYIRYLHNNSCWLIEANESSHPTRPDTLKIFKINPTSTEVSSTSSTFTTGTDYNIVLKIVDNVFEVYKNDVLVVSYTADSFNVDVKTVRVQKSFAVTPLAELFIFPYDFSGNSQLNELQR